MITKPLTVYKASAGSGKTFTLAVEYIKLLISNPTSFRQILAVTFTNKATDEMKTRILSELYGIWKQLPSSESYTNVICSQLSINKDFASKQAGIALVNLLHNYSYFRVETIDSFFQSVMRNLARELGLTANLRVGLNDQQVEEEAVDSLIDNLGYKDPLLKWLMDYITENINDDKSWNVIGQIKSFGNNIFREFYKQNATKLRELSTAGNPFFSNYTNQLKDLRKAELDKTQQIAATFFDEINASGLTEDNFSYSKRGGVYSYFLKLKDNVIDNSIVNSYVQKAIDSANNWGKKKDPEYQTVTTLAEDVLQQLLKDSESIRPEVYKNVQSATLTLRHLSQLRLLSAIEDKVQELNNEAGRFLLSDTQPLLNGLIEDSDSPFIYEKIGSRLEHIMIDEFQDTSSIQWANFNVLLSETMSHSGSSNLIVGDVKQSIYRWRSGDWRLLNNMKDNAQTHVEALKTNWRSARNIVAFNNEFFRLAAQSEANQLTEEHIDGSQLTTAYSDVEQNPNPNAPKGEGWIRVELIKSDNFETENNERVLNRIKELLSKGCPESDICILVRNNRHIPIIAEYLMLNLPEANIVSDEAFRLDASQAVNIIVLAMYNLINNDDKLSLAKLVKLYQVAVCESKDADNRLLTCPDYAQMLPDEYTQGHEQLLAMPLYDMAEKLYSIFSLDKLSSQSAYICAFFDQLSSYITDHPTDIASFLREWESAISSVTIQSDKAQGIRIISIHKSKGLEFSHVIIPFCDWQLEKTMGVQIWCEPQTEPFNQLPLAAIDYSKKQITGTIYEADYNEEHLQNTVDNLNLLYVAFTRAAKSLYVIGQKGKKNSRSTLLSNILPKMSLGQCDESDDSTVYTFGTDTVKPHESKGQSSGNVFKEPYLPQMIDVRNYPVRAEFKQSNRSRNFISGESPRTAYIQTGTILHRIFSTIRTTADIPQALRQLELEGVLYSTQVSRKEINAKIEAALKSEKAQEWFSTGWKLFNECEILTHDDTTGAVKTLRPDRVMYDGNRMVVVDFKFGQPKSGHSEQVRTYMNLLRDMGYTRVEGFLWYVMTNKTVEVR